MDEVFGAFVVRFIPVSNCFVHLHSKCVNKLRSGKELSPLKILADAAEYYLSCSSTTYDYNGEDAINLSSKFAECLGIREYDNVIVYRLNTIKSVKRVCVTPVNSDDYSILVEAAEMVQNSLLNQIRVVYISEMVPVWISKSFVLKIHIDNIGEHLKYAKLDQNTEIVVLAANSDITSAVDTRCQTNDTEVLYITEDHKQQQDIVVWSYLEYTLSRILSGSKSSPTDFGVLEFSREKPTFSCLPVSWLSLEQFGPLCSYDVFIDRTYIENVIELSCDDRICKLTYIRPKSSAPSKLLESRKELFPQIQKDDEIFVRLRCIDTSSNYLHGYKYFGFIYVSDIVQNLFGMKIGAKVKLQVLKNQNLRRESEDVCFIPATKMLEEDKQKILESFKTTIECKKRAGPVLLNNMNIYEVNCFESKHLVFVKFSPSCLPFLEIFPDSCCIKNGRIYFEENDIDLKLQVVDNFYSELSMFTFLTDVVEAQLHTLQINLNLVRVFNEMDETSIMNTNHLLILGATGSGKSRIIDLMKLHLYELRVPVYIKSISCRSLKGKTSLKIEKKLNEAFSECVYYEPSILFLDDLDSLFPSYDKNEDLSNKMRDRLSETIRSTFTSFMFHSVTVIATATDTSVLGPSLFSARGDSLFVLSFQLPQLSLENRKTLLRSLVFGEFCVTSNDLCSSLIDELAAKMEGYCIRDIVDFRDKLFFEILKNNSSGFEIDALKVNSEKALIQVFPGALQGIDLHKNVSNITFKNVGGLDYAKQTLTEIMVWPSMYPEVFDQCPLKAQSGVLLYGMPGSGKTLLAAAVAGECNINFISIKGPELLSKYAGSSEEKVRETFKKAENAKPCILFFDEFESLASRRGNDVSGVTDRVVNQFLTEIDGVESRSGIWVLAATSRPDLIDPALLRPGRLGTKICCPLPNTSGRLSILKVLSQNIPLSSNSDIEKLAEMTENYTGADLNSVLCTAYRNIFFKENVTTVRKDVDQPAANVRSETVTWDDLIIAVKETPPSLKQKDRIQYEQIYRRFSQSEERKYLELEPQKLAFA